MILLLALIGCGSPEPASTPTTPEAAPADLGWPQVVPMDDPAELIPDCEAGDGPSCFNLGVLSLTGQGMPADPAAARAYFDRACGLQIDRACANRDAIPADPGAACDGGDPEACLEIGRSLMDGGDAAAAVARFQQGCEAGGGRPCTDLGVAYTLGRGVPADPAQALVFYKKGCARKDPAGCVNAARAYYKGEGVTPDPALAAQYLTTACKGGSEQACERLKSIQAGGAQ